MARFELVDEGPVINNSTVALQVQEMFISSNTKEWAEANAHVIMELDEETAKRVDNCVSSLEWLKQISEDDSKDPKNSIIIEFLNKRPDKYRKAAKERRKAGSQIVGSVRKAVKIDKSEAS